MSWCMVGKRAQSTVLCLLVLFWPSADWVRPALMVEGNFFTQATDPNAVLFWTHPHPE